MGRGSFYPILPSFAFLSVSGAAPVTAPSSAAAPDRHSSTAARTIVTARGASPTPRCGPHRDHKPLCPATHCGGGSTQCLQKLTHEPLRPLTPRNLCAKPEAKCRTSSLYTWDSTKTRKQNLRAPNGCVEDANSTPGSKSRVGFFFFSFLNRLLEADPVTNPQRHGKKME